MKFSTSPAEYDGRIRRYKTDKMVVEKIHSHLIKHIPNYAQELFVADLGCGTLEYYPHYHNSRFALLIDINQSMISRGIAVHHLENKVASGQLKIVSDDILNVISEVERYDLVLLIGLLDYIDKKSVGELLKNVAKATKPGGKVIIVLPSLVNATNLVYKIYCELFNIPIKNLFRTSEVTTHLTPQFKIVERLSFGHYFWMPRKLDTIAFGLFKLVERTKPVSRLLGGNTTFICYEKEALI
jgi:SAM-dependent methyltransferase